MRTRALLILNPIAVNPFIGTRAQSGTHNDLDCSSVCEWDIHFEECYRYVLFNNLVLAVLNMGQMSESGTLPECKMVFVLHYFLASLYAQENLVLQNYLSVPKTGQILFSGTSPECRMFLVTLFFCNPLYAKVAQS